jgi:hypothetical protein
MLERYAGWARGADGASGEGDLGRRALEGLQALLARFLCAPEVTLIDVGADAGTGSMALRVHVRSLAAWFRLSPPEDVNGIPVRAVVPAYDGEE